MLMPVFVCHSAEYMAPSGKLEHVLLDVRFKKRLATRIKRGVRSGQT